MTNKEAFDLTMFRLGSRTNPELRTVVVLELNERIKQIESGPIKPWFMEQVLTGNLSANQGYIVLPETFLQEVEDGKVRLQTSFGSWKELIKTQYQQIEDETINVLPAFPEGYALFGSRIYFGPTPNLAYAYRIPAYLKSAVIADDNSEVSNPRLVHFFNYTTLATASFVASTTLQSADLVMKLAGPLKQAYDDFWRAVEARQHVNMDYQLEE